MILYSVRVLLSPELANPTFSFTLAYFLAWMSNTTAIQRSHLWTFRFMCPFLHYSPSPPLFLLFALIVHLWLLSIICLFLLNHQKFSSSLHSALPTPFSTRCSHIPTRYSAVKVVRFPGRPYSPITLKPPFWSLFRSLPLVTLWSNHWRQPAFPFQSGLIVPLICSGWHQVAFFLFPAT